MKSSKHTLALSLSLALAACAAEDELMLEPEDQPELEPQQPWTVAIGKEMQGKYMLGKQMDSLQGDDGAHLFSASDVSNGIKVKLVGGASLDATTGTLAASKGSLLEFTYASSDGDVSYYSLRRHDPITKKWTDPCDGTLAVPFVGTFTRTGVHEPTPGRLSFACDDGVGQKCAEWGYPAGSNPSIRKAWRAHETCTQAARADLCASGDSNTREETPIEIYDFVGVNGEPPAEYGGVRDWPPPPSEFYYEAAYLDGHETAFCVGKARWPSIPPEGPVGCQLDELPDPRQDNGLFFCEEYDWENDGPETGGSVPLPAGADVLIVIASAYNDLPIDTWQRGNDYIGTVRGYNQGHPTEPPFPGGNWKHQGAAGFLLRVLPGSVDPSEVVRAAIWDNGNGDRILGPVDPLPDWPPSADYTIPSTSALEGYLFLDGTRGNTEALRLYKRTLASGADEYLSSAVPPLAVAGYTDTGVDLGWVIAPLE
jgi:hypothetical protein